MTKTLEITFRTEQGKEVVLNLPNPKDGITLAVVQTVMNSIQCQIKLTAIIIFKNQINHNSRQSNCRLFLYHFALRIEGTHSWFFGNMHDDRPSPNSSLYYAGQGGAAQLCCAPSGDST